MQTKPVEASIWRLELSGQIVDKKPQLAALPQRLTKKRCKLEPHREFLLALVDKTPDLTISELVERLLAVRGVKVSCSTLWAFLDRCGLTLKKVRARQRAGSSRRRPAARRMVRRAVGPRSRKARLHRRNVGEDKYG